MEEVFSEKCMDLIEEANLILLKMADVKEMVNPVATCVLDVCERALVNTTFCPAQEITRRL